MTPTRMSGWHSRLTGPGMGGVFEPKNLNGFGYTHQNPIVLTDPDGSLPMEGASVDAHLAAQMKMSPSERAGFALFGLTCAVAPLVPELALGFAAARPATTMALMTAGTIAAEVSVGPNVVSRAPLVSNASQTFLVGVLKARALQLAGFAERGTPVLVDPSSGIPMATINALRAQGFNLRTVDEAFGTGKLLDPVIRQWAERAGVRVLNFDRARDIGGGFGPQGIRLITQGQKDPAAIAKILTENGVGK